MENSRFHVRVRAETAGPVRFVWEIYVTGKDEPFLMSKKSFRTQKAANADAQALLARHARKPG